MRRSGDPEGARKVLQRALEIEDAAQARNRPNRALTQRAMAEVLVALGDLPGARTAVVDALGHQEEVLGPDHPEVGPSLDLFADILAEMGDRDSASIARERARKIKRRKGRGI